MPIKLVLNKSKVPVKIWTDDVASNALDQLTNVASMPFVFSHVAAMPDVHLGVGATVGSVIATKGAVMPAAVGVDIGCGMTATKLDVEPSRVLDRLDTLYNSITRSIPVGHEGNRNISDTVEAWPGWDIYEKLHPYAKKEKAKQQLGSLGGGNHFIEICVDTEGKVWVMLHSGSRNIGKTLAEDHTRKARGMMKQLFISLPDPDLAYFVAGTPEYSEYLRDLNWAQSYALENRTEMMRRVLKDVAYTIGDGTPIPHGDIIDCHHNFAAVEQHFDTDVLVTRKGAVRARAGDLGIIPGSMGTRSYIVRGLGNPQSFHSCSHGAGRRMSRGEAKKSFTLDDLAKQTEGVRCRKDDGVLDEIPGAYKPIDEVMANSTDLVEVVAELKQVLCIKG